MRVGRWAWDRPRRPTMPRVRGDARNVAMGTLLVILVLTFYPALMLGRRVAPEASLRSVPPWRHEWGPSPDPPPRVLAAATQLGPRLAVIARDGDTPALWDPWIGGGRPGWLSSAREGGAPLTVTRPSWRARRGRGLRSSHYGDGVVRRGVGRGALDRVVRVGRCGRRDRLHPRRTGGLALARLARLGRGARTGRALPALSSTTRWGTQSGGLGDRGDDHRAGGPPASRSSPSHSPAS